MVTCSLFVPGERSEGKVDFPCPSSCLNVTDGNQVKPIVGNQIGGICCSIVFVIFSQKRWRE